MADLLYLTGLIASFLLLAGLVKVCARIVSTTADAGAVRSSAPEPQESGVG
jgi:hypothetical protein